FSFDPRPTTRHTVWSVVLGGSFYWASMFCTNQASVQKYMSVGSLRQAKQALCIACVGLILVFSINFYTGLVMHSHYDTCDPLITGAVTASDQLLPLYVMQVLGSMRGVAGLFVAGIFAASLGTVAAALNSLSAVTCEDLLSAGLGIRMAPSKGAFWAKWLSLAYGIISFALVFVVERMGGVLQVALSFNGMAGGVTLGLFTLGMCVPRAVSRGALWGAACALGLVLWLGLGAQIAGEPTPFLPGDIHGCECLNATVVVIEHITKSDAKSSSSIYNVSYLWYSALGCMTTVIVGVIVSEISRLIGLETDVEPTHTDLLSPPARWFTSSPDAKVNGTELNSASGVKIDSATGKRSNYGGETNLALSLDENPEVARHI
ncbi:sodium-coupled monocarboxylate transporter 1-like, partial [Ctenocephalides felis]|uniref:sodium-coupled monocarboxylate transporter 1-like n=1 Tax=Ctenocephalides felis TaxID=7515 RepID=UPI000E6E5932